MGSTRFRKFTNELGNDIRINVTVHDPKMTHGALTMTIYGPTSSTQSTVTIREAQELYELLDEVLIKRNKEIGKRSEDYVGTSELLAARTIDSAD